MLRRLSYFLVLLLLAFTTANAKGKKPFKKLLKHEEKEQIRFYGFGAFAEKGAKKDIDNETINFGGGGVYSRLGADYDINLGKKRFGWYHSLNLGYGKPKYIPFVEDIGFTGAYRINENHEIGATYSFLGWYANTVIASFGSQFSLLYRYRFLQVEFSKMGQGIVKGCFVPTDNITNFSATLSVLLPKNFILSGRIVNGYNNSHHINPYSEYRLALGVGF